MEEYLYFLDQEDGYGDVFRVVPKGSRNEDYCVWDGEKWVPSQEAMDVYWWDRSARPVSEDEAKRLCEEYTKRKAEWAKKKKESK